MLWPVCPQEKKPILFSFLLYIYIGDLIGLGIGLVGKILLQTPPGFEPQTVHPIASCYTNYTILAAKMLSVSVSGR